MATLTVRVDSRDALAMLAEANELLSQSPDWLQWLAAQALHSSKESFQLVAVDCDDDTATPADHVRLLAKPSEGFRLLVSALRAGNGKGEFGVFGERDLHGGSHA